MSIVKFNLNECPALTSDEKTAFYPSVEMNGLVGIKQLSELISRRCSFTTSDSKGMIDAFSAVIAESLASGYRVELPEIGSFGLKLACDDPITDFNDHTVARKLRVQNVTFRPKAAFLERLNHISFRRSPNNVPTGEKRTDEELLALLRQYLETTGEPCFTRSTFESVSGYKRVRATKALKKLSDSGQLLKQGTARYPLYTLATSAPAEAETDAPQS